MIFTHSSSDQYNIVQVIPLLPMFFISTFSDLYRSQSCKGDFKWSAFDIINNFIKTFWILFQEKRVIWCLTIPYYLSNLSLVLQTRLQNSINKILLFYKIKVMFKSWRCFSKLCVLYVKCISTYTLTFLAQISQNGQIHSTNSPANCRWIVRVCLTICLGLTLKRFNVTFKFLSCRWQKSRRLTLNFGKVENSNNCCYQLLYTCLEIM